MSTVSTRNPVDPVERKDIRSASLPFKQDKDKREKWSNGVRLSPGVIVSYNNAEVLRASNEGQRMKIRPNKHYSQMPNEPKSHANKTPKPHGSYDGYDGCARLARKASAVMDAKDHTSSSLSKSLLELLPQHSNNTESAIQVALRESAVAADADILYSYDNKGPSPGDKGRKVDLGGLVDLAEKKWLNKKTEEIVKGEYEVLDNSGETVHLKAKGKKSPKQKATKFEPVVPKAGLDDDDFELIDAPLP
ncbi:hypothetical protein ONS95_001834 [Cadophora gregata]|uniref:uncharacterized protein n=1 Tax=Cadophora gregata TaxID=51156 RepID=UPI0026DA6F8E|nr:uncharacterized protein ONS95_001834 [Cadophora gregata]KAK0111479.1 hypothetical protein ONS95_001834 [Cadophora gregata]KAK0112045.1 hypothetical protein ONS96_001306 [Cadophora gregata f. sp. sojae]